VLLINAFLLFQDAFFYCLVFDPSQKTLLADKGEIRVGSRYQTEVTNLLKDGKICFYFKYL
jgi:metastasis-associated protein MTA